MKIKTKQLTQMAILAAMSILLVYLIHFPFVFLPGVSFLEYDPADIPILIGTFMFGPIGGLLITAVVCAFQGFAISTTGFIGAIMHFLATGSFVLVAGNIYKRNRTRKGAIIALILGGITMTVTMVICNLVITPMFLMVELKAVLLLMPWIIVFNLLKVSINGGITFVVYKSVSKVLGLEIQETKIAESK